MKVAELLESLNDDDYYLVNTKSKTVLKRLGKQNVPFGMNATEVLKDYITDPTCQKIMTGMKVRSAKISESIKDFDEWKVAVLKKYPTKALKFKGRVENGKDTISAEVPGEDRSYGVWDQDKEEGEVLTEGKRVKNPDGTWTDLHTGVTYSGPKGQDGNDSYMDDEYKIKHYKERLAKIEAGPHKYPKEVSQIKARLKRLGVSEDVTPEYKSELDESLSTSTKKADKFRAELGAKLSPLGFKADRSLFVSDDNEVIKIEADVDEHDVIINWAIGSMKGSKPKFKDAGYAGIEDSRDLIKMLLKFAKD